MTICKPTILLAGLDFDWTRRTRPNAPIDYTKLQQSLNDAKAYPHTAVDIFFLNPDDAASWQNFRTTLTEGPKGNATPYDGIVIAYGLRADPSLNETLEDFINAIRVHASRTKIIFATPARDHVENFKRVFPQLKDLEL